MSKSLDNLLHRRASFLAFVQRRVGDRSLAEDILQSAYVRALQHGEDLRQAQSAVAWFYIVLRNAVVDHFRSRASENSALERWARELETEPHAGQSAAPDEFTHALVCGCIKHLFPTLRPAYAEILREVDLAEQPLSQFAARHQLTPGNAAVRAHRARAALRRQLVRVCGACSLHACLNCSCKTPRDAGPAAATRPSPAPPSPSR
ncbi:MAG TPA: sigma-70 family RNA polymerase sigma factor [Acidobacteriaceae bacterium]|jgi:RNA polymerase sigma-70 factor (ECF subfamily)|nr:sigma-70 family RNA polymerase sigma factor [Acidobacteriaceae bacterium]